MDLREHKNAIKRFLAIFLGSCSSLTLLKGRHLGEHCSNVRLWRLHAAVAWSLARTPSAACSVAGEADSVWFGVPTNFALGEQNEYRLAIGADRGLTTYRLKRYGRWYRDLIHLLLLLYGYYQSRFGLIPRSRGGRWGLIKATVCSNILQMFVRY